MKFRERVRRSLALLLVLALAMPAAAFAEAPQAEEVAGAEYAEEATPAEEPVADPDEVGEDADEEPATDEAGAEEGAPDPGDSDSVEDSAEEVPEEPEEELALEDESAEAQPVFAGEAAELRYAESLVKIGKGESYTPALLGLPEDAIGVRYESSKPKIFTVDSATGEIEGLKTGKGKLTATAGAWSASVTVQVCGAPKKFSLDPEEVALGVGEVRVPGLKFPKNTYGHVKEWRVGDASVATGEGGSLRGVAPGRTNATAVLYNGLEASCAIVVLDAPSEENMELTLPRGSESGVMGVGETVEASVRYDGAAGAVEYRSENEAVATVDAQGRIKGIAPGAAKIVARAYNGVEAPLEIAVKAKPDKVEFANAPASLCVGESWTLQVKLSNKARDDCGGGVTYKSSKASVLDVDPRTGLLTAKKKGKAKITATAYSKAKKSVTISVKDAPESIELDRESLAMGIGEELTLAAKLLPAKSGGSVRWESTDPEIVAVDGGKLSAGAQLGTATIRASAYNAKNPDAPLTASCRVTVKEAPSAENAALEAESAQIGVGQTTRLRVVSEVAAGSAQAYASSAKGIAKVDKDGVVKGVKKGTATITAVLYNGVELSTKIDVLGAPSSVSLSAPSRTLYVGQSFALESTLGKPGELCIGTVKYKSSKPAVATVDGDGLVTAVAPGTAKITATTQNKKTAKCVVTVKRHDTELSLSASKLALKAGESATLTPVLRNLPGMSARDVTWDSSNAKVAAVSDGRVIAVGKGSATISASVSDPLNVGQTLKAKCKVSVKAATGIVLSAAELKLQQGESATLWITKRGLKNADDPAAWTSSDEGVASVKGGRVVAVAPGSATITATVVEHGKKDKEYSATCTVTVEAPVAGISLNLSELQLRVGESALLRSTVSGMPDLGPEDVRWESSEAEIASVEGGRVAALSAGTAMIRASVDDPEQPGRTLTAECAVTVEEIPVGLVLDWEKLNLTPGKTARLGLTLVGAPEASTQGARWTSSNLAAVTVSGEGEITAVAEGTSTITASLANPLDAGQTLTAECVVRVLTDWSVAPEEEAAEITQDGRLELRWRSAASDSYAVYEVQSGHEALRATVYNTSARLCGVESGTHTYVIRPRIRRGMKWEEGDPSGTLTVDVEEWRDPPEMLSAEESDPGCVALRWSSVRGAESYVIYEMFDDETLRSLDTVSGTVAELSDVSGGMHSYAVRAVVKGEQGNLAKPASVRVNSLELDPDSLLMYAGMKRQINAIFHMDASADHSLRWSSSNESVATVDEWGRITALASGDAKITAQTADGGSATCAVQVASSTQEIGDFTIVDGVVVAYRGSAQDVIIPDCVIGIGPRVFSEQRQMKSVTIPSGVMSIGESAFYLCDRLQQVRFPDSLRSIGDYAFAACSRLVAIDLPYGVERIGKYAFSACGGATSLTIPNSVTSIGDEAFQSCLGLTRVTIPGSLREMGSDIFFRCLRLEKVVVSQGVTKIGKSMFDYCTGLKSVSLPSSLTEIESGAFYPCESLASIEIPSSVTKIGEYAFCGCAFRSVTIPDGVTSIERRTFGACEELTSVHIPDSVTSIGDEAFSGCMRLPGITIPESVKRIGDAAFEFCDELTSIKIPESVTSIGDYVFEFCPKLADVELPEKLSRIGRGAFMSCESLERLLVPDSVTEIGADAFDEDTTIICSSGSYAEDWAKKNGCSYELIGMAKGSEVTIGMGMRINMRDVLGSPSVSGGYRSENPKIADFDTGSVLRGISQGSVYVSDVKGFHRCHVTVVGFRNPVVRISIGDVIRQEPVGISGSWKSSNPRVARVDEDGKITAYTLGSTTITVTQEAEKPEDVLRASFTIEVIEKPEEIYTEPAYLFLGIGDSGEIRVPSSFGSFLSDATFVSADDGIASVDESGHVIGIEAGRTRITATSADNSKLQAVCDVVVLRDGDGLYAQGMLEGVRYAYEQLLRGHAAFDGGYTNFEGKRVEPVNIGKLTNNLAYQAYDFLGDKSGTLPEDMAEFTDITYIVDKFLTDRSEDAESESVEQQVWEEVFSAMELPRSLLQSFLDFAGADDVLSGGDAKKANDWLRKLEKSDPGEYLEFAEVLGKGLEAWTLFGETLQKAVRFSKVRQEDVMPEINLMLRSGDDKLQSAAMFIEYITRSQSNAVKYVACTMGFSYGQKELIDACREILAVNLETIPVVGWFFVGANFGKEVGYAVSNALTNADDIMSVAFDLEKANKAAGGYVGTVKAAYDKFMRNPASEENLAQFRCAVRTFSTLVECEYLEFEEFVRESGEGMIAMAMSLFRNLDEKQAEDIQTVRSLARFYSTGTLNSIAEFEKMCNGVL